MYTCTCIYTYICIYIIYADKHIYMLLFFVLKSILLLSTNVSIIIHRYKLKRFKIKIFKILKNKKL